MLKTLSVLHTPELLHVLASMGHGDEVALVDCNFPAASTAQRLVRLDGAHLPAALEACMQLLSLDTFVDKPALRMMQVHAPMIFLKFSRNVKELSTSSREST
jgi:L-fucose mutarotase